jgi:hypothetical protein
LIGDLGLPDADRHRVPPCLFVFDLTALLSKRVQGVGSRWVLNCRLRVLDSRFEVGNVYAASDVETARATADPHSGMRARRATARRVTTGRARAEKATADPLRG